MTCEDTIQADTRAISLDQAYDATFAHKPWLIKHEGVVYHFYCAVGGEDQHRAIALATSKEWK